MDRSFKTIREWDGSQWRAFEELTYQLRDPTPEGAQLIKTGNPDGGIEWYVRSPSGDEWGWQVKYSFTVDNILKGMRASLESALKNHPRLVRLTFCIPIDLPDGLAHEEHRPQRVSGRGARAPRTAMPRLRGSGRERLDAAVARWCSEIPSANHLEIGLETAGDILAKLARPGNVGMRWFWWDQRVFDLDWCRERLERAKICAASRYTPALHVALPIEEGLDALGLAPRYWDRLYGLFDHLAEASQRLMECDVPDESLQSAKGATSRAIEAVLSTRPPAQRNPLATTAIAERVVPGLQTLMEATARLRRGCSDSLRTTSVGKDDAERRVSSERLRRYDDHVTTLWTAIKHLLDFLDAPAARAMSSRAYFLQGEAGQGKTHLFVDAARRALAEQRPAVVVLAETLSAADPWGSLAKAMGLPDVGSQVLVGAMSAAAEAHGARFVLLIDALNEADQPERWRGTLPAMLAEFELHHEIALAVSCRTTYRDIVLPDHGRGERFVIDVHPGFAGREVEALRRYCRHYEIDEPRVPILVPDFTNPLFLKLYCQGLQDAGLRAAPDGAAHRTATFERFVDGRASAVCRRLRLDPADGHVRTALQNIALALAERNADGLPRQHAKALVDSLLADRTAWPDTLYGAMRSEGLIDEDVMWCDGEFQSSTRLPYQAFSDHVVVRHVLARELPDGRPPRVPLPPDSPLRMWLEKASDGRRLAATIQCAETVGVELLDLLAPDGFKDKAHRSRRRLMEFLIESLPQRASTAVTTRTRDLLAEAQTSYGLGRQVLGAWLAVACQPRHIFDARRLHQRLCARSLPERDASWSLATYSALSDDEPDAVSPIRRLIDWAYGGVPLDCEREVVLLAGIVLGWACSSPNLLLRNKATHALASLLLDKLDVAADLIELFAAVDDPYVVERVLLGVYGALLRRGDRDLAAALMCGEAVLRRFFATRRVTPCVLVRDAAAGIVAWCAHRQLIPSERAGCAHPPYESDPPEEPPSRDELRAEYERAGDADVSPYRSLAVSVLEWDFYRYVIWPRVLDFSQIPRGGVATPHRRVHRRGLEQDAHRAARWIFKRCIDMGWTPERFGPFDERLRGEGGGVSDDNRAERVGKKYQWIALHELLGRLSDNFERSTWSDDAMPPHRGAWQHGWRRLDPSLPLSRVDVQPEPEIALAEPTWRALPAEMNTAAWWIPSGPRFERDLSAAAWVARPEEFLGLDRFLLHSDNISESWLGLEAYMVWQAPSAGRSASGRREQWQRMLVWLAHRRDLRKLVRLLTANDQLMRDQLMGRTYTSATFLGEIPWSPAAEEDGDDEDARLPESSRMWRPLDWPNGAMPRVASAGDGYAWETDTWGDTGKTAHCNVPGRIFHFVGLPFRWDGNGRRWCDNGGAVLFEDAEVHTDDLHAWTLLGRQDRVEAMLVSRDLGLICAMLGERRVLHSGPAPQGEPVLEIYQVGSWDRHQWRIGPKRYRAHAPFERRAGKGWSTSAEAAFHQAGRARVAPKTGRALRLQRP